MSDNKLKSKLNSNKLLDPHVEYITRNFFAGLATFWFGEKRAILRCNQHKIYSWFWPQVSRVHTFYRSRFGGVCRFRLNFHWPFQLPSDRRRRISS